MSLAQKKRIISYFSFDAVKQCERDNSKSLKLFTNFLLSTHGPYHLVGLVVKASTSRAEDAVFESCLRQDFFGFESYQ